MDWEPYPQINELRKSSKAQVHSINTVYQRKYEQIFVSYSGLFAHMGKWGREKCTLVYEKQSVMIFGPSDFDTTTDVNKKKIKHENFASNYV